MTKEFKQIPLEQIVPDPDQPRRDFTDRKILEDTDWGEDIDELSKSVKEYGVLQPILVREIAPEQYMIIAGERRYRASKVAGLNEIPALVVNEISGVRLSAAQVIENVDRKDLSAFDLFTAITKLMDPPHKMSFVAIDKLMGKPRNFSSDMYCMHQDPDYRNGLIKDGQRTAFRLWKALSEEGKAVGRKKFANTREPLGQADVIMLQTKYGKKKQEERAERAAARQAEPSPQPEQPAYAPANEPVMGMIAGAPATTQAPAPVQAPAANHSVFEAIDTTIHVANLKGLVFLLRNEANAKPETVSLKLNAYKTKEIAALLGVEPTASAISNALNRM